MEAQGHIFVDDSISPFARLLHALYRFYRAGRTVDSSAFENYIVPQGGSIPVGAITTINTI